MIGSIVNSLAVIAGSLLGLTIAKGIPKHNVKVMEQAVALCVILIGLQMSIEAPNVLLVLLSLVIGGGIGGWLRISEKLDRLGDVMQKRFGQEGFSRGFINATLLFSIGSMSILGAIESGLRGDHSILFLKSAIDAISSLVLTTTLGYGVIFAAIPLFIYQGGITLMASLLEGVFTAVMIEGIRSVGGLLIASLGINMLFPGKVRTSDMLPAIFLPVVYYLLMPFFFS